MVNLLIIWGLLSLTLASLWVLYRDWCRHQAEWGGVYEHHDCMDALGEARRGSGPNRRTNTKRLRSLRSRR